VVRDGIDTAYATAQLQQLLADVTTATLHLLYPNADVATGDVEAA
jgi:hypothetical protein